MKSAHRISFLDIDGKEKEITGNIKSGNGDNSILQLGAIDASPGKNDSATFGIGTKPTTDGGFVVGSYNEITGDPAEAFFAVGTGNGEERKTSAYVKKDGRLVLKDEAQMLGGINLGINKNIYFSGNDSVIEAGDNINILADIYYDATKGSEGLVIDSDGFSYDKDTDKKTPGSGKLKLIGSEGIKLGNNFSITKASVGHPSDFVFGGNLLPSADGASSIGAEDKTCKEVYSEKFIGNLDGIANRADTIKIKDTYKDIVSAIVDIVYPVGSLYISLDNRDPEEIFKGTSWERVSGAYLYARAEEEATGEGVKYIGNANNIITSDQLPGHSHAMAHTHTMVHNHSMDHSHTIPAHTHSIKDHNHPIGSHTHTLSGVTGKAETAEIEGSFDIRACGNGNSIIKNWDNVVVQKVDGGSGTKDYSLRSTGKDYSYTLVSIHATHDHDVKLDDGDTGEVNTLVDGAKPTTGNSSNLTTNDNSAGLETTGYGDNKQSLTTGSTDEDDMTSGPIRSDGSEVTNTGVAYGVENGQNPFYPKGIALNVWRRV